MRAFVVFRGLVGPDTLRAHGAALVEIAWRTS